MNKIALKVSLFSLILFVPIALLKLGIKEDSFYPIISEFNHGQSHTFFFIGSSRVRKGLDPDIIQVHFPKSRVYNLGITGSTFLSNVILAEQVILKKGKSTLFVEISPFKPSLPKEFVEFSKVNDFHPLLSIIRMTAGLPRLSSLMLILETINIELFSLVSIKKPLSMLITNKTESQKSWLGYNPAYHGKYHLTTDFLKIEDIENLFSDNQSKNYSLSVIHYLQSLAQANDSEIVFFLPITFIKAEEKGIDVALYNSLSKKNKLIYTQDFLEKVSKREYLLNKNHFNLQGSKIYSSNLVPIIKNSLIKKR